MDDEIPLLDSPRRNNLEFQSTNLRTTLKDFERNFAVDHGRKPNKDDIKAEVLIANTYKEYNRIRDVLSGKLSIASLNEQRSPKRKRSSRTQAAITITPRKKARETPIKPHEIDPYDSPVTASPKAVYLHAIAPTPHRDGQVLGLLDMLSTPGSTSIPKSTPRKDGGKRNDLLGISPQRSTRLDISQTPSQRKAKVTGDILDYLSGTPPQTTENCQHRHSKTPASDGKKFLLSQFFATPSAVRYSRFEDPTSDNVQKTPLRDDVLGKWSNGQSYTIEGDATPGYLKRSISFKDRLMSAAKGEETTTSNSLQSRSVPPTLRHFKSATSITKIYSTPTDADDGDDDEHEDELEALRELENDDLNIRTDQGRTETHQSLNADQIFSKPYKKKGQKRTTRRAIMRPTLSKDHQAPKFVAAESDDENIGRERWKGSTKHLHINGRPGMSRVETDHIDEDCDFSDESISEDELQQSMAIKRANIVKPADRTSKSSKKSTNNGAGARKSGMINPNAQSHMNFRSLKIKNKNSRAKGAGRGRFGKHRR